MKERRLAKLTELIRKLESDVDFRAAEAIKQGRKMGSTGLVCETWKSLGSGEDAQLIPEYTIDGRAARRISLKAIANSRSL